MSEQVEEIKNLLAQFADFQDAIAANQLERDTARASIIPADVQVKLAQMEEEFGGREEEARGKLDRIKSLISEKMVVLPAEEYKTVHAGGFMVVAKGGKPVRNTDADTLVKGLNLLADKYPTIASEISDILQMSQVEKITSRSIALQVER